MPGPVLSRIVHELFSDRTPGRQLRALSISGASVDDRRETETTMLIRYKRAAAVASAAVLLTAPLSVRALAVSPDQGRAPGRHVLLLSVDGLHESDLAWYVTTHPSSALARLVAAGRQFTDASTPYPS